MSYVVLIDSEFSSGEQQYQDAIFPFLAPIGIHSNNKILQYHFVDSATLLWVIIEFIELNGRAMWLSTVLAHISTTGLL